MDKSRSYILVAVLLLCGGALYFWNMHDKEVFLRQEMQRVLGVDLPRDVRIINGQKSELWLAGSLTVYFEATAKDLAAMTGSLDSKPYDVCAGAGKVPYLRRFHPSECFYAGDVNIKKHATYVFWSLYEHKGVLHWVEN